MTAGCDEIPAVGVTLNGSCENVSLRKVNSIPKCIAVIVGVVNRETTSERIEEDTGPNPINNKHLRFLLIDCYGHVNISNNDVISDRCTPIQVPELR